MNDLDAHIESNGQIHLFDVPLHYNFAQAGKEGGSYDMRTIFDGTLVKSSPESAVTFIDNHDTQPFQDLESYVEPWFKPLAAAVRSITHQSSFFAEGGLLSIDPD